MIKGTIFSYSSYNLYENCPGAYGLKYVEKVVPKIVRDFTGTVPGHVVHDTAKIVANNLLSGYDNDDLWTVLVPPFLNIRLNAEGVELGKGQFAASRQAAEKLLLRYAQNLKYLIHDANLFTEYMLPEFEFGTYKKPLVVNDLVSLAGAVDLYSTMDINTPGRLVDYKASDSSYRLSRKQLQIYQIALELHGFKVSSCGFLLFKSRKQDWFAFTKQQLDSVIDQLCQASSRIMKVDLPFTPSKSNCRFCDFINDCDSAIRVEDEVGMKTITEQVGPLPLYESGTPEL